MRRVSQLGAASVVLLAFVGAAGCNDDAYCYSCDAPPPQPALDAGEDATAHDVINPETGNEAEAASCPTGYADCNLADFDGCEINIDTDKRNCGECGNACSLPNAGSECKTGLCAITECEVGFEDCDSDAANGCEAEIAADPDNCNGCGNVCPAPANSSGVCLLGACTGFECNDNFADCDGDPSNGCEVSLLDDIGNCGLCGRLCDAVPHAAPACIDGSCGVGACEAGTADCDNSVWSGCETILESDVNHCGACGEACPAVPNGAGSCVNSTCEVGSCNVGYADCDLLANGCEAYLASDVKNCGACGNQCPDVDHGAPGCSHFQCGIATCDAGWGDCSGGALDGCETDLDTDVNHCGTCPTVCADVAHGSRGCTSGACVIASCDPDFEDCNSQVADGCETDVKADLDHCGGCNSPCPTFDHATAGCFAGTCAIDSCETGYSNCDSNQANGCEKDTSTDPENCGGCFIKCGSGACQNSKCVCNDKALLIGDESTTGTDVLAAALTAAGFTVTKSTKPSYQYDGASPATTDFGMILLLAGGPGSASYSTDMPAAGQQAIFDFVGLGNGLVLTEWAALHVQGGRWQTLAPLVLLKRTVSFSGQVNYALDPAFLGHPIWDQLPTSFTFASTSNVGLAKLGLGIKKIASSDQALDAVAIRDLPSMGRVVHLAHAGNYAPNGWTNTNVQKLVGNSVRWAGRCD